MQFDRVLGFPFNKHGSTIARSLIDQFKNSLFWLPPSLKTEEPAKRATPSFGAVLPELVAAGGKPRNHKGHAFREGAGDAQRGIGCAVITVPLEAVAAPGEPQS